MQIRVAGILVSFDATFTVIGAKSNPANPMEANVALQTFGA
jgi:hypothetical protein